MTVMSKEVKMYNYELWEMNKDRQIELHQIAWNAHRLKKNTAETNKRKDRVLLNVGDFMVSLGMRLKARYEPAS